MGLKLPDFISAAAGSTPQGAAAGFLADQLSGSAGSEIKGDTTVGGGGITGGGVSIGNTAIPQSAVYAAAIIGGLALLAFVLKR